MKTIVKSFIVMCGMTLVMIPFIPAVHAGGEDVKSVKKASDESAMTPFLYPNPCKEDFTIKLFLAQTSDVKFTLFDMYGRAVVRNEENGCEGENNLTFELSDYFLPCGQYVLQIEHKFGLQKVMIIKS